MCAVQLWLHCWSFPLEALEGLHMCALVWALPPTCQATQECCNTLASRIHDLWLLKNSSHCFHPYQPEYSKNYNNWNCVKFCQPSCLQVYICFTTCVFQLQLFSKCSAPSGPPCDPWPSAHRAPDEHIARWGATTQAPGKDGPGQASCHKSVWKWGTRYSKYLEIS